MHGFYNPKATNMYKWFRSGDRFVQYSPVPFLGLRFDKIDSDMHPHTLRFNTFDELITRLCELFPQEVDEHVFDVQDKFDENASVVFSHDSALLKGQLTNGNTLKGDVLNSDVPNGDVLKCEVPNGEV